MESAPIAGKDESKEALRWIQNRITWCIPEEDSNRSCISWSQSTSATSAVDTASEEKKVKGTYTYCRFGFTCAACESATLKTMEECLKGSQRQVYELPRSSEEIRINKYNPLLLMLWKTNMDIRTVHCRVDPSNCTVHHWLCDKGREE